MLDIIKAHAVKNLCYIAAKKMVPQGIVVHSTGANNPNLKRYVDAVYEVGFNQYGNHWNTPKPDGRQVCVHAFIGYDKNKEVRVAEILLRYFLAEFLLRVQLPERRPMQKTAAKHLLLVWFTPYAYFWFCCSLCLMPH